MRKPSATVEITGTLVGLTTLAIVLGWTAAVTRAAFQAVLSDNSEVHPWAILEAGPFWRKISLSPDGDLLAVDTSVATSLRSVTTGEAVTGFPDRHKAVFGPSGRFLVAQAPTTLEYYRVGSWSAPEFIVELSGLDRSMVRGPVAIGPDSEVVWIAVRQDSAEGRRYWLSKCGRPVAPATTAVCDVRQGQAVTLSAPPGALEFSTDGRELAVAVGAKIELRDAASAELQSTLDVADHIAARGELVALSYSPSSEFLVGSFSVGSPLVFDLKTQSVFSIPGREPLASVEVSSARKAIFSKDGRFLFVVLNGDLMVWETEAWSLIRNVHPRSGFFREIEMSARGQWIAAKVSTAPVPAPSDDGSNLGLSQSFSVQIFRSVDLTHNAKPISRIRLSSRRP